GEPQHRARRAQDQAEHPCRDAALRRRPGRQDQGGVPRGGVLHLRARSPGAGGGGARSGHQEFARGRGPAPRRRRAGRGRDARGKDRRTAARRGGRAGDPRPPGGRLGALRSAGRRAHESGRQGHPAGHAGCVPVAPVEDGAGGMMTSAELLVANPETFEATNQRALEQAEALVAKLKSQPSPRRTVATLAAFDEAMATLSDASSRASVARNAHPDAAMRDVAERCEQQVDALATRLSLDRGIYDALRELDPTGEDPATRFYLQRTLRDFRRAGVDRDEATRKRVQALNEELVRIGQEFSRNIREDVRSIEVDPADLAGLPEDYVRGHPPGANGKVTITTDYPDYVPFLSYARSEAAREKLWRVYRQRAHPKNLSVLARMLEKRYELATLLGYPSWAAYVTEDKMIGSAQAAADFIARISA